MVQPERLGRYEILGSLARGGMAELFLAQLPGAQGFTKQVVIKRVLPDLARDREFVELFLAEARIAATLDHQNIVHVHDIGEDARGYFFAMELLHGADVGAMLSTHGALPPPIAIEIARNACAGLHYAHERRTPDGDPMGLVHRDISPQNLFVTFDGAVKVLDFGIAKAAQTVTRTRTGGLRGKVPYMSPEQCSAQPLDRRSDVFSLAVVLWEMTVGERLFEGDELAMLRAIVDRDAPAPSMRRRDYPPELERIVMRGLARDLRARYQTCDELQADLEALARSKGWWQSAREMAAYMAQLFPDRAQAWRDRERLGTRPMAEPRATTPLAMMSTPAGAPTPVGGSGNASMPIGGSGNASMPVGGTTPVGGTGNASMPVGAPTPVGGTVPGNASIPVGGTTPVGATTPVGGTAPVGASGNASLPVGGTTPVGGTGNASMPVGAPTPVGGTVPAGNASIPVGATTPVSGTTPVGGGVGARSSRRSVLVAIGGLLVVAAIAAAFVAGRASGPARDAVAAPKPPAQVGEDAQWFQPDDYLISERDGFTDGRLDFLWVSKSLAPIAQPGAAAKFLDANGHEVTTEHYWKTRAARPEDLAIGSLAFCRTFSYLQHSKPLHDRAEARITPWMLGRITDVAHLPSGQVTIADCVCDLGAVRVIEP